MFLNYASNRRLSIPVGLILFALSFGGCSNKADAVSNDQTDPKQLLAADLQALQTEDTSALQIYDSQNQGLITKIFGGTSNQSLRDYLDTRLHYYVSPNDQGVGFSRNDIFTQNWEQDPALEGQMKADNAVVGAANIGIQVWMASLVSQVPVTFIDDQDYIPVDSSRVGIMIIGDGYEATLTTQSGKKITIPAIYRQSILIHEARHSDCTGGISQATLTLARNSTDAHQFSNNDTERACGHLHTYCPPGSQYENLPACDGEPWGAYAIQAVFDRAMTVNPANMSTTDWEIMNASAIDSEFRVTVPRVGLPDMSSGGRND